MKLKISVAVDFNKLANEMPKIIEKTTQRYARSAERGSKEAIDKGVKPKLKESTIARRKRKKYARGVEGYLSQGRISSPS